MNGIEWKISWATKAKNIRLNSDLKVLKIRICPTTLEINCICKNYVAQEIQHIKEPASERIWREKYQRHVRSCNSLTVRTPLFAPRWGSPTESCLKFFDPKKMHWNWKIDRSPGWIVDTGNKLIEFNHLGQVIWIRCRIFVSTTIMPIALIPSSEFGMVGRPPVFELSQDVLKDFFGKFKAMSSQSPKLCEGPSRGSIRNVGKRVFFFSLRCKAFRPVAIVSKSLAKTA